MLSHLLMHKPRVASSLKLSPSVRPTDAMEITRQFELMIHNNRSPVTDEFFGSVAGFIFEKEFSKAKIEARCWSSVELLQYHKDLTVTGISTLETPAVELTPSARQELPRQLVVVNVNLGKLHQFIQVCELSIYRFTCSCMLRRPEAHSECCEF